MAHDNTSDAASESPAAESAAQGEAMPAASDLAPEGLLDTTALVDGLDQLKEEAADSVEVAKQLEE